jgi:predicted nucleic acid-binding protein
MQSWFCDSAVLLLALGGEHPQREACRELLASAASRSAEIHMSVEAGQEILFHRMRMVGREQALTEFELVDRLATWHDFTAEVLRRAVGLVEGCEIRGRDAIHAATALVAGFTEFVSPDQDFDAVPGLKRKNLVSG